MDINNVILVGRLTKDADIRTGNDKTIAKFSIAVNRMKKDEADFLNCVAFGKTAEIVEKYTHKGSRIAIRGRIQTGSYEKDGRKVYTTDIIAEEIQLLDPKSEEPPVLKNDNEFANIGDNTTLPF